MLHINWRSTRSSRFPAGRKKHDALLFFFFFLVFFLFFLQNTAQLVQKKKKLWKCAWKSLNLVSLFFFMFFPSVFSFLKCPGNHFDFVYFLFPSSFSGWVMAEVKVSFLRLKLHYATRTKKKHCDVTVPPQFLSFFFKFMIVILALFPPTHARLQFVCSVWDSKPKHFFFCLVKTSFKKHNTTLKTWALNSAAEAFPVDRVKKKSARGI